jgi:LysM repeat protein
MSSLSRALKIDQQRLRELNPALLRSVWDGQRRVPKAFHLRLPIDGEKWTNDMLAARLSPNEFFAGQPEPRRYRVRRGDTVASVADQFGVTPEALARLNRVRTSGKLKVGRVINLPESTAGTASVIAVAGSPSGTPAVSTPAKTPVVAANQPSKTPSATVGIGVLNGGVEGTAAPATSANSAAAGAVPGTSTDILNGLVAGTPPGSGTNNVLGGAGTNNLPPGKVGPASSTGGTAALGPRRGIISSPSGVYVVQSGESLSDIASKFGMTETQLLKLNGIRNRDFIFEGQQILVTATPPSVLAATGGPNASSSDGAPVAKSFENAKTGAPVASTAVPTTNKPSGAMDGGTRTAAESPVPVVASGAVPAEEAARESVEEAKAVAKAEVPNENSQPVSAAQAEELSPSLGPSSDNQQSADPTDYSVAKDNTIRVAAAETLGHYAEWLGVSAAKIRSVNKMKFAKPVLIGHRIKLEFGRVSREEFEEKRREYHVELQATYFAEHRIIGTEVYIVRKGDALWHVTQRFDQLPIWLLQQYNPDVDLADLRPGTQIVMPRVENVVSTPG